MPRLGWSEEDIYVVSERAHALHTQGRYDLAVVLFEGLVALDPDNLYCRDALGAAYLAMGRPEEAANRSTEALAVDAEHAPALARRCEAYLQLGRIEEARADYTLLTQRRAEPWSRRMRLRLINI